MVFLHTSHAARAQAFSAWSNRGAYAPLVTDVAYGQWGIAEVDPGQQGFAGRLAGMEPPTTARLGWNAGMGNLEAGRAYFIVVTGATADRVDTRSHNPPRAADGAVAGRILGLWTGPTRVDVCTSAGAAAANLGGTGYMAPLGALNGTVAVHPTASAGPCSGTALARFAFTAGREPEAVFVFGATDGELRMVACAESGSGCRAIERAR